MSLSPILRPSSVIKVYTYIPMLGWYVPYQTNCYLLKLSLYVPRHVTFSTVTLMPDNIF